MTDTDSAMLSRYLELIRGVPKPERFIRALALSALVRDLAWQGATRHAGHLGADAVVERFLLQLYGSDVVRQMRVSRESGVWRGGP
ncbi:MAG: hypothetical protein ABR543_19405 [Gemmatimonadaceae bacterium]